MRTAVLYQSRSLDVRDVRIPLLQGGSGPPLLWLHGAGGAGVWNPAMALLAQSFTIYAPSHPGFEGTEWPAWLDGIDDLVLHYRDLLEVLQLERPVVVGASLGGWIAAELAVWYADRVGKLVLEDAAGISLPGVEMAEYFVPTAEASTRMLYFDQAKAELVIARQRERTPEQVAQAANDRAATARLAWNPYFHDPKLLRRLARIDVPTLVVWGAQDRLFPLALGEAYARGIPGAELAIIDRCGHAPHNEQPEELARVIGEFLQK